MADIALALLIVNGKILMCKREKKSSDKFSEMYGLPGGHIKKNESNKDGAIRETKEETNLTINNPKFVKSYKFGDNQIYLYAEEIKNIDDIKLNHEHTDYKLVSPKDLKNPEIIPTTKDMYKDYKDKPLNEELQRIKSIMKLITEDLEYSHVSDASPEKNEYDLGEDKYTLDDLGDDWMNLPIEDRTEKLFGKQTNLQKQFSKIIVDKLNSDDEIEAYKWATYQAIIIELKEIGEHKLIEEIEYRITDKENPINVFMDIIGRVEPTPELYRLKNVLKDFKDIE